MNILAQIAPLPTDDGVAGWEIAIAFGLILLGVIVALARSVDVWRRRRRDRALLRGRVTDALMRSERLAGLMLVPRVRLPFWSSSPAAVVVSGTVRTAEERELARTTAREAALVVRSDIEVEDRMAVASPRARVA